MMYYLHKIKDITRKACNELPKEVYFRHLVFGSVLAIAQIALFTCLFSINWGWSIWLIGNVFIYPYSRFVYESVFNFIIGDNLFFVNAVTLLVWKVITMYFCLGLAVFIAPIGLTDRKSVV